MTDRKGAYGPDDDITDFILGITFEIWEERGVELIAEYYAGDCIVWGLDGITHGADEVIAATWQTLEAFPDRMLLAEQVVCSGSRADGFYSSHRLHSTGTNRGPSAFGPATGTRIHMTNIADCVVEDGRVTREWLVRDTLTLATQLGADVVPAARKMAADRTDEHQGWIDSEVARVSALALPDPFETAPSPIDDASAFATQALRSAWTGDRAAFDTLYAPYAVLYRAPLRYHSGRDAIFAHFQSLRRSIQEIRFSVDHVATLAIGDNQIEIAARWTLSGVHAGEMLGVAATHKPLFILGVTHWRCVDGRVATETTVFDELALLSQVLDAS